MNARAEDYLRRHAAMITIDGREELSLPLDKVQGFLDLLSPADVPPEKLQTLYAAQATLVRAVQRQFGLPAGDTEQGP
jgi:hypothetical protein